jgi:hypothetical protein
MVSSVADEIIMLPYDIMDESKDEMDETKQEIAPALGADGDGESSDGTSIQRKKKGKRAGYEYTPARKEAFAKARQARLDRVKERKEAEATPEPVVPAEGKPSKPGPKPKRKSRKKKPVPEPEPSDSSSSSEESSEGSSESSEDEVLVIRKGRARRTRRRHAREPQRESVPPPLSLGDLGFNFV